MSGHSDRDVITVFDKNVCSGVMGAKTSTEGIQERRTVETFASVENSYESFAHK